MTSSDVKFQQYLFLSCLESYIAHPCKMERIYHGHYYDYDLKESSELPTNEIINEFRIYQNKISFYLVSEIEKVLC